MIPPLLSIVIPAFNVEAYIEAAVHSALAQTIQNIEVIVVDDGSTDGTAGRVQALDDPRIRLIRRSNRGLAATRNVGIRHARGFYVGFLDGDDLWKPERAARHLDVMEQDPRIGVTYSHYAYIDESGRPTGEILFSSVSEPNLRQMVHRNRAGSSVILRMDCLMQSGLFDESLRSSEDYDLWIRVLARTPFRLRLVPEPLALYRVRPGSLTMDFESFLRTADRLADKLRHTYPEIADRDIRRGHAEHYRIAARKALAAGRADLGRRHLRQALRIFPLLPLLDVRAIATTLIVLATFFIPKRLCHVPYRGVASVAKIFRGGAKRTA
jgi:GT2 family glycosyltransferase